MNRYCIIASLVGVLSSISFVAQPSFAQREGADLSALLTDGARCVTSQSDSSGGLDQEKYETSINRQFYESQFSVSAYRGEYIIFSCQTDPELYSTLSLQMGASDDSVQDEVNMTVNVYQSGNIVDTYHNVQAGTLITTVLDLQRTDLPNPENIAVEMLCQAMMTAYSYCHLRFVEAQLFPTGNRTPLSNQSMPAPASPTTPTVSSDSIPADPTPNQNPVPASSRQDASPPSPVPEVVPANAGGSLNNVINTLRDLLGL
jgi:hypothetical protein